MISIALAILDSAIANTALPTIARELRTTPAASVWIVNAYQLSAVATLLPLAALGGVVGHRRVYIGGLAIFTAASTACALSDSLPALVAARVLQGIGGAGIMAVNTALLAMLHPGRTLGRAIGLNALVVGAAFALGPVVASLILSVASWPWLFAVNLPIGIVALVLSSVGLPRSPAGTGRFDFAAAAMTTIAFAALVYGLAAAAQGGRAGCATASLVLFAAATVTLSIYERGSASPMLPLDLLRRRTFALSTLTAFCAFAAQGLAFVALPFHLGEAMSMSALQIGIVLTPWSIVVAAMGPLAGRLSERNSTGLLRVAGLTCLAIGMLLQARLPPAAPLSVVAGCMGVCGFGFGLFQTPNQKAMMDAVPTDRSGAASGVAATARLVGQATGTGLVALCFVGVGADGPVLALLLGAGFAAAGATASASRGTSRSAPSIAALRAMPPVLAPNLGRGHSVQPRQPSRKAGCRRTVPSQGAG